MAPTPSPPTENHNHLPRTQNATARITAAPFVPQLPVAAAIRVSLVEPPNVDFDLRLFAPYKRGPLRWMNIALRCPPLPCRPLLSLPFAALRNSCRALLSPQHE